MEILGTVGSIVILIGWIWTIVMAFKTSGVLWGILNIVPLQPLIGIISAAMKKVAWTPVLVLIIGTILWWLGGGMAALSGMGTMPATP